MTRFEKTISLTVQQHKNGRLIAAYSNDLPGLLVHAHSVEELNERVPVAIKALMEAQGAIVEYVHPVDDVQSVTPEFVSAKKAYQAKLAA